jgi:glycosyltransferase involved in cell wall biosynthesis
MAIELTHLLGRQARLVITHRADDEGLDYWRWLKREASMMNVKLQLVDHMVCAQRKRINKHKVYSIWDAYSHADLITYPSSYEGFGNALLETIYFKRPAVINRYPVYNSDIRPLGFQFIELDGFVHNEAVVQVDHILQEPKSAREMIEANYALAQEHFSFEVLEDRLEEVLRNF